MKIAITIISVLAGLVILQFALWPWIARAEMLQEGQIAPDFSTQAVAGGDVKLIRLSDYRGREVILYFYPKDDTPGCTKEACAFRDGFTRLDQAGVVVLGCSVDAAESHIAFIKKYQLPFPLLLDPDKKIAAAYGAANGIPILGLDRRITYVIGPDGKILKVYPRVDPATHAGEILHDLGADKSPGMTGAANPASPSPAGQEPAGRRF